MNASLQPRTQHQTSQRKNQNRSRNSPSDMPSLFEHAILDRQVAIHITSVGKNLTQTLERCIKMQYEGKCSVEGFIKVDSAKIISYSAGNAVADLICFAVVFECQICHPVEGMYIQCTATNITKAGIRAESVFNPSPIVVFVTRDHNYDNAYFSTIKEGDSIKLSVIGQRFELNDTHISVVAQLVEPTNIVRSAVDRGEGKKKPKIVIK